MQGNYMAARLRRSMLRNALAVALATCAVTNSAYAQEQTKSFDVPAQSAATGLNAFAEQADITLVFSRELVANVSTKQLKGEYPVDKALATMLEGTRLSYQQINANTFSISDRVEGSSANQNEADRAAAPREEKKVVGDVDELEKMVVTGSRIHRVELEGPSPVIFLSRQELERTGRATVAEALATLPQNFAAPAQIGSATIVAAQVDIRGLGADNTLVLINGRRAANSGAGPSWFTSFTDLNSIPLSAVERIEILTDGASAVYGSDAVAGVVNVILKKDYRGAEVTTGYGGASEGGASERRLSFTMGGGHGGVSGLLSGEYFNRSALNAADRSFSRTNDQRADGGRDFRVTFANPGNVSSLTGQNLPGLNAPSAGIPFNQDGKNLTPSDFVATSGVLNKDSLVSYLDIVAPSERWGITGRFNWETSSFSVFGEVGVSHTVNRPHLYPSLFTFVVPANNPFNPFGQSVRVQWLASELGRRIDMTRMDNRRGVLGINGSFGESWQWESSVQKARDEFVEEVLIANTAAVNTLLSRTNPATALNVFGDGVGVNNPVVLQELAQAHALQRTRGVSELWGWEGHMDGVLANWAGRDVRAAVGAEYREEGLDHKNATSVRTTGDRQIKAAFAEISVPIFGSEYHRRGIKALELQLAARWENYSDFGDTFNPRLAIRWQPVESLALRASASTGFRAPALRELFGPVSENPSFPVIDPRRNNESTVVAVKGGANPELKPEESKSWNLGLVWDLPVLTGLSMTLDWYGLKQEEVITNSTIFFTQFSPEFEARFPGRYRRAEPTAQDVAAGRPGRLLEIDARAINIGQVTTRGLDLGVTYRKDTSLGRFDLRANATYVDRLELQVTPFAPLESLAGTTRSGLSGVGSPVRFRGNVSLFLNRGNWEFGVTERYTGAPRETRPSSVLNGHRYDEHYETDLQLNYKWPGSEGILSGTRLSFGVENLFNAEPPFADEQLGYLGMLHSPRQRFIQLNLTKAF